MLVLNEINYGPLTGLIGDWEGNKGMDVAPDPEGEEHNPYFETLSYTAIGDVTNAEKQTLAVLHYRQRVSRIADGEVFHDQTGYWMWDATTDTIMHSFTIPRAVAVLAGGFHAVDDDVVTIDVTAGIDDPDWQIVQSPFMKRNARTIAFVQQLILDGDSLNYRQTTMVEIYGDVHEHTDDNVLTRKK